jgi:hypothetical protein
MLDGLVHEYVQVAGHVPVLGIHRFVAALI